MPVWDAMLIQVPEPAVLLRAQLVIAQMQICPGFAHVTQLLPRQIVLLIGNVQIGTLAQTDSSPEPVSIQIVAEQHKISLLRHNRAVVFKIGIVHISGFV